MSTKVNYSIAKKGGILKGLWAVALLGLSHSYGHCSEQESPMPSGITLCVAPMESNFDAYIVGEMEKQKVPVTIVAADPTKGCDPSKSAYTMTGVHNSEGKSLSARSIFGLRVHYRDEIEAAVKLVRNSDSVIVWAGDSDRGELKKVAEHIVAQMMKQRPMWINVPINR